MRIALSVLACCALLGSGISGNAARRCRLLDEAGRPIPDAFVLYHYSAGAKQIWPRAHYEGPFVTRTGQDGRFAIPLRMHLRFPLVTLTSPVRLHAGAYIPRLHNFCTLLDPAETDSCCARPVARAGERSFRAFDLSARPAARFRTLWLLIYGSEALARGPAGPRRELLAATRREYGEFLSAYGTTVFDNSSGNWGHIRISDWTRESGANRPWSFFLQRVPFYGITMEEKLSRMEREIR